MIPEFQKVSVLSATLPEQSAISLHEKLGFDSSLNYNNFIEKLPHEGRIFITNINYEPSHC